jgi:hypothetical protein
MFGHIIPHLATLIVTVRKNVLSSLMTFFLLLVLIIAWSARGNVSTWFEQNPTPHQQAERVQRGLESSQKIEGVLRQNRDELNADRVFIRQFHDQIDAETSVVIPSATITHISTAPGVSIPPATGTPYPRTYISQIIDGVFGDRSAPVCIVLKTTEILDPAFRQRLVQSGAAIIFSCPVLDITGVPIGLIHATYLTENKTRPSDEVIFSTLNHTASRVAGYLAEVTAPERESWYRKLLDL